MSKVTSKLQVTIPKAIAEQFGIAPGDEIHFVPAGDAIRVQMTGPRTRPDAATRLRIFDQATERQRRREQERPRPAVESSEGRGWRRDDLYEPPRGWRP